MRAYVYIMMITADQTAPDWRIFSTMKRYYSVSTHPIQVIHFHARCWPGRGTYPPFAAGGPLLSSCRAEKLEVAEHCVQPCIAMHPTARHVVSQLGAVNKSDQADFHRSEDEVGVRCGG